MKTVDSETRAYRKMSAMQWHRQGGDEKDHVFKMQGVTFGHQSVRQLRLKKQLSNAKMVEDLKGNNSAKQIGRLKRAFTLA